MGPKRGSWESSITYDAEQEATVEEGAHAAHEGDEKDERTGGHAKVAAPIVALD